MRDWQKNPPRKDDPNCTGLPDGWFSNQKYQIRSNLEGLVMQNVVIFYGHL
jgi:hypothetical protein